MRRIVGFALGICVLTAAAADAGDDVTNGRIQGPTTQWLGNEAIPDNSSTGLTIDLPIAGALYPISDVTINITLAHTWVGDLEAVLESPGGASKLRLFNRPGYRKSGNSGNQSNFSGTYSFDDFAPFDLWFTIAGQGTSFNVPSATYRTSTGSRVPHGTLTAESSSGGCATYLSGAFGGLSGSSLNGTWKLKIYDHAAGDLGSVTQVLLVAWYPQLINRATFDLFGRTDFVYTNSKQMTEFGSNQAPIRGSAVRGSCRPAQYDADGDGLTDFFAIEPEDVDGDSIWYVRNNDGTASGALQNFRHGQLGDIYLMDDFDGDGADDPVVWRRGADGFYEVRRSSRPGQVMWVHFGTDGVVYDDPTQSGDFDGDGVADFAHFRIPSFTESDGPAEWVVATSSSGSTEVWTYATGLTGVSGDYFPIGGFDSTGDGIADLQLQTPKVGNTSVGHWHLFDGVTGTQITEFDFELSSDVIFPGNHVGNTVADVTVRRLVSGVRKHYFRDGSSAATSGPIDWGVSNDISTPGDYDGDGLDDLAVWRPSTGKFYVRKSSDPMATFEVLLGTSGYFPVAASRLH